MFWSHNCGCINIVLAVFWLNCLQYNYLQWTIDCIGVRIREYNLISIYIYIFFFFFLYLKLVFVCLALTMLFFSFLCFTATDKHTSIKTWMSVINHTLLYSFSMSFFQWALGYPSCCRWMKVYVGSRQTVWKSTINTQNPSKSIQRTRL